MKGFSRSTGIGYLCAKDATYRTFYCHHCRKRTVAGPHKAEDVWAEEQKYFQKAGFTTHGFKGK